MARFQTGQQDAFNSLVRRWEQRIYNFILRSVGNREEAWDLCQETFTKAFQNLDRLKEPQRFSAWLYKIALNECRMRRRKWAGRQEEDVEVLMDAPALEASPEERVGQREMVRHLRQALRAIPDDQRLVIVMKEYQHLKFHEIAELLDVPLSTVKSRLYLGLRALRKELEKLV
ncbi:MAG: sigma-70 family RNA polymerase sigma factor [Acidobacteria bacterium]|nr:sigma-70 family RNA polymerase sigma factor [Acidobacteriota bacterium]